MLKFTAFTELLKLVMCVCYSDSSMLKELMQMADKLGAVEILVGDYDEETGKYAIRERYFKVKSYWCKKVDL